MVIITVLRITGFYDPKMKTMVQLNYNNLDEKTQGLLLSKSKKEVEGQFGKDLKAYAIENGLDYCELLNEEAIRNLYNYKFIFNI